MQEILKILGGNIRKFRKDLGWTQEKLAERAGISVPFMTQIELGKKSASLEVVAQIADALGMPYDVLFSDNTTKSNFNNAVPHIIQVLKREMIEEMEKTIEKYCEKLEQKLK